MAFKQASSFGLKTTIPRSQNIKLNNNQPLLQTTVMCSVDFKNKIPYGNKRIYI